MRSIYNDSPTGYRAWWLACQKSHVLLEAWEKPFSKLNTMPASATMLIVEPFTFSKSSVLFGQEEAEATLDWVEQGNTLVLLDDFRRYGSQRIAEQLLSYVWTSKSSKSKLSREELRQGFSQSALQAINRQKTLDVYLNYPVLTRSIRNLTPKMHDLRSNEWQSILEDGHGHPLLLRLPYGKGTLVLGTVMDLGDNQYLYGRPNDNAQFLTNLLLREGKPIFVNEYVHGYEEAEDLLTYLGQTTPLGVIFVQLLLGFILLLWLSATRWTPKPQEAQPNGSIVNFGVNSLEVYIQSLARIYARSQAASLALEPQLQRIEALLRQRFRLSLEDEERLRHLLVTSSGDYSSREGSPESSPEALINALRQAQLVIQNQERLTPRELLRLARQLTLIEERLHYERHRTHVLSR